MSANLSVPGIDPMKVSNEQWQEVYVQDPHTSFNMINDLMEVSGVDIEALFEDSDILREKAFPDSDPDPELFNTILDGSWTTKCRDEAGRCTSFAVKIAHALEKEHNTVFQFQYFDLGGHRVARCEKTAILIDSVSDEGAKIMLPNTSANIADWRDSWRRGIYKLHPDGWSIFKANEPDESGKFPESKRMPIKDAQALSKCLFEVARYKSLVCAFRTILNGNPAYLGVIRWVISLRQIQLFPDLENRASFHRITFGGGTPETLNQCMVNFVQFIKKYGERDQWVGAGLTKLNGQLWRVACRKWGLPVWNEID